MTRTRWFAVGGAVAFAVVLGVVIAAVGSDDGGGSGASEGAELPPGIEGEAGDIEALRECISDQGVELPGPGERPDAGAGGPDPALLQAMQACAEFVPEGRFGPGGDPGDAPPGVD